MNRVKIIDRTYKITVKKGLNVRSGPGTGYKKLGDFKAGTEIRASKWDGAWIYLPAHKGWVCWQENGVDYVRMIKK